MKSSLIFYIKISAFCLRVNSVWDEVFLCWIFAPYLINLSEYSFDYRCFILSLFNYNLLEEISESRYAEVIEWQKIYQPRAFRPYNFKRRPDTSESLRKFISAYVFFVKEKFKRWSKKSHSGEISLFQIGVRYREEIKPAAINWQVCKKPD